MVHQAGLLLLGGLFMSWSVLLILMMKVIRDLLRRKHQFHRVPVGHLSLFLGLRSIVLAHHLIVELFRSPVFVLELFARVKVFHWRPRIDLNMEWHDVTDSNLVPSIVLHDNVQVVPNVHDLPNHGWCEIFHDRPQVLSDLAEVALPEKQRCMLCFDIVKLWNRQS